MAEPQDFHSHGGKTRQRKGNARQSKGVGRQRDVASLCLSGTGSRAPIDRSRCCRHRLASWTTSEQQRGASHDDVEGHRDQLRGLETDGRDQREVRQETAQRCAGGVDAVENGNSAPGDREILADQMTDEERERAAHQQRDRRQQQDRDRAASDIRRGGEDVPSCRVARVGRRHRGDGTEVRQKDRDGESKQRDHQFDVPVRAQQRVRLRRVATVRPCPDEVAAHSQAQHEYGNHE